MTLLEALKKLNEDYLDNVYYPTEEDIKNGNASFLGMKIKYVPNAHFEGRSFRSYMEISDKFFDLSEDNQHYVLVHEVAHNVADDIMEEDWDTVTQDGFFVTHKIAPKGSTKGDSDFPDYWEGLFGDIGPNSLAETIADSVVYYYLYPDKLKTKSKKVYDYMDNWVKEHGKNTLSPRDTMFS